MKQQTKFKQTEIGKIPEDWEITKLGSSVKKIFCGRDPKGGKQSHSNKLTAFRIIQSAPVFDGYLDKSKVGYISKEQYLELKSAELEEEDVLLNQLGDGITFARSCIVPKDMLPAVITRSVGCIRCNKERLSPWFLNAYLILPQTKNYIGSFNSGSSRRAIDGGKMKSFIIPLPKIKEQQEIGKFYKIIQDKIELNNQMNRTLENIGQAFFKKWFIDERKDTWEIKKLPEIARVIDCLHTKKPEEKEGGKLLLQFYNMGQKGLLNLDKKYFISEEDYSIWTNNIEVEEGDILINNAGFSGNISQTPYNFKAGIGRNITAIRATTISPFYLLLFLHSQLGRDEIEKNIDRGTIFDSFNVKGIKKVNVLIPDKKSLESFDQIIKPIRRTMEKNFYENYSLMKIRDSLLPKLMNGEIRANG